MTTALYDAAALIRARFAAQITTGQSLTTVHDNVPNASVPSTGRWCRLSIRFGLSQATTVGGSAAQHRTTGVAIVQLFEPFGNGDGSQLQIVDAITTAFRGVTLAGPPVVHFDPPYVSGDASVDDGLWQTNVAIPFRVEEL